VIRESAWLRSFPQGAGHAWTEITYAQDSRRAEAVGRRHVQTQDRRQPWGERDGRQGFHLAGAARRPDLAAAGRRDGRSAGASALPVAHAGGQGSPAATSLGSAAPRAASARGDAAAVVGGASRHSPRRLWLQPFLRALSRLGGTAVASHAAEPCRRRAHVRRLRRHDAHGDRRIDRRSEDGAAVRRRARRVELHLRRGHLDARPIRLDRLAHPHLCLPRRGSGDGGVRQSARWHHQGLLLRASGQPHLRRDGGPLQHCHCPSAAVSSARQSQG
jgi:hypothetical protein